MVLMESDRELLRGTVLAVTFQNIENGYSVLKLREEGGDTITVVGVIPMAVAGEQLLITGHWMIHPSYGKQFEAEFLERLLPQSSRDILVYLSSRTVKGIGPATAKKIVDAFGEKSLDVLENDPDRLSSVGGLSRKKAIAIHEAFCHQSGMRRLIELLSAHQIPVAVAIRLYKVYGAVAAEAVREDPYLLVDPVFGADFAPVDAFAQSLGVEAEAEQRLDAGVLFTLSHNLSNGHVFIPLDKLAPAAAVLLDVSSDPVEIAIERLHSRKRVVCDRLLDRTMVYLPDLYYAETYVCERLREMAGVPEQPPKNLEELLDEIGKARSEPYAPLQLEAIRAAAVKQAVIVTGGPGTGKTTTMAGILTLFRRMGLKTVLAAPTGRAAKRLTQCTGEEATTIHRLLESQYDPETDQMLFSRDEVEPLKAEAVIVDEASMIDLPLMCSLLKAMRRGCRLVLVGDPDQLPSVGPGNVFSDVIRSGVITTVRLTEIFRQAQESMIVLNAHAINRGEMPRLDVRDKDFFFLRRMDPEALMQTVCDLCTTRLPQNMGIPPTEIQVLSPTRKGGVGTFALNVMLQTALNPSADGKKEKVYGGFTFREGDRVMQIRNNYDILWKNADGAGSGSGIFNGDIGMIRTIDHMAETMTVDFEGRLAEYGFPMLSELEPAYAMTVHKSQGSEYRAVILSVLGASPYLLTRNVLYTAVTRARELMIVIGSEEQLATMVRNDRQQRRYSGLKLRMEAL